jgi:hypothetical protein
MFEEFKTMGFDGAGGGPLDTVPGIPKKGTESPVAAEFGKLAERYSGDYDSECVYEIKLMADQYTHRRTDTSASRSSNGAPGMHRRMASDSSMSSGGYTLTGIGRSMA